MYEKAVRHFLGNRYVACLINKQLALSPILLNSSTDMPLPQVYCWYSLYCGVGELRRHLMRKTYEQKVSLSPFELLPACIAPVVDQVTVHPRDKLCVLSVGVHPTTTKYQAFSYAFCL